MERKCWTGTFVMGLIAFTVSCGPTVPPAAERPSEISTVRRASPKPGTGASTKPASLPPNTPASEAPSASPSAQASATAPVSVAPSLAASVAPSVVPSSLETLNPTIAALGCKPVGAEVPVVAGGDGKIPAVAAVYGHGAVTALDVTRGTAGLALKAPAPVDVVLTAHPGAPASRISAYTVVFKSGATGGTTIGSATRVSIPAIDLPAAPATHFGHPVAVPVVLPVGQLKAVLTDAPTAPTVIRAEIGFLNEAGVQVRDKALVPLVATVLLPLGPTAGAANLPATEACAGPSPVPFVPEALVAGPGGPASVVEWRQLAPYTVVRSAAGVLSQTNVGIALAAPPGSAGGRIDSLEATYEFPVAGKPPAVVGPIVTNLATPVVVPAGSATAYSALVFTTLPFSDAGFAGLKGTEGVVLVTFKFKSTEGGPVVDKNGNALKVVVPILCE